MTANEFVSELKKGISGSYFFFGSEEYLIKFYIGRVRRAVLGDDETMAAFNHYVLKWGECSGEELESALAAVPMMAEKTLVELYCDFRKIKDHSKFADLFSSFDPESSVLLLIATSDSFDAGNYTRNKASEGYKIYSKIFRPVDFCAQTPTELKKWIARRFSRDHIAIDNSTSEYIIERCGKDMFSLSGELDKLASAALARNLENVTYDLVSEITIANDEDNAFALANAIINGDRRKALSELAACKRRQEKAPMVLGSVSKAMCDMLNVSLLLKNGCDKTEISKKLKIHEYRAGLYIDAVRNTEPARLRAAADRCREADVQMKTSRLDYIALERLICTIPSKTGAKRK